MSGQVDGRKWEDETNKEINNWALKNRKQTSNWNSACPWVQN